MESTAKYKNRIEDKENLEKALGLPEFGNDKNEFFIDVILGTALFAIGYNRVVYGDHGPYIEFDKSHIKLSLKPRFNNQINWDTLPKDPEFYYYWLEPKVISTKPIKVYWQLKSVENIPNAPKRKDGKKSNFNRKEGYADYKPGYFYVDPYDFAEITVKQ